MNSNLYMPIFYNSLELASALSDEEFGRVVRLLLSRLGYNKEGDLNSLSLTERMAYGFMLDGAMRIIGREKPDASGTAATPPRSGGYKNEVRRFNFDPSEAFQKAIERTYGKKESEPTSTPTRDY